MVNRINLILTRGSHFRSHINVQMKEQALQNWGEGGGVGAMPPPLFCQAKLYVELDFKISTEVLNFEIIHSIY